MLKFRQRTTLLPFSAVLGSLSSLSSVTFSDNERRMIVLAAVEEVLWEHYRLVPAKGCLQAPYVEGRFANNLNQVLKSRGVNLALLGTEMAALRQRVFTAVTTMFFTEGYPVRSLPTTSGWDGALLPAYFDHGYELRIVMPRGKRDSSLGRWLQLRWQRPVVDMLEMSVCRFLGYLADQGTHPDLLRRNATMVPLHLLLTAGQTTDGVYKLLGEDNRCL